MSKKTKKEANQVQVVKETTELPASMETKETKETKAKKETKISLKQRVKDFLVSKGSEGATVIEVATALNMIDKETDKVERFKVTKKLRVLCRNTTGGASPVRNGQNAVYIYKH